MNKVPSVTLLIPCFNEEDCIPPLFKELHAICSVSPSIAWNLLFINDGSLDKTEELLAKHLSQSTSWCNGSIISLSRNFGKEAALIAGLDECTSDACIIMDADLQDPPDLIPEMIHQWINGSEIVNAKRVDRSDDIPMKRLTAWAFYRIFKRTSKLDIEIDSSDFRLLDRSVVESIKSCRESIRFSKGFFAWAGFNSSAITYKRPARYTGQTKWGSWRLWNYALDGIFSFSTAPLRLWSYAGAVITLASFSLGIKTVLTALFQGNEVPGYASTFVAITFLGGIQLIGIGVLGEYVGRTYIEAKKRPLYLIKSVIRS